MWSAICESAMVCGIVLESEVTFAVLHPATPLSFVEISAFLGSIPMHLIITPVALVYPSINEVKNTLSVFPVAAHVALIALSIFRNEDALPRSLVIFPLPKVDISTVALKDACAVPLPILQLALIGLSCWILHFLDILEELRIRAINIILQKALNDALLLLFQPLRIGGLHVGYSTK